MAIDGMAYKLVILVRQDLKLPKGKLAVQVAHASVDCVLKTDRRKVDSWINEGGKKVVLKVLGLKELFMYEQMADSARLKNSVITDAGRTTVSPGTVTCIGIGPDEEKIIDTITRDLKII
jgi:peptidyl-tRNA hydrolase, PTH2 family